FVLMNVGSTPVPSKHGLLTTAAWRLKAPGSGEATTYALEGSAFIAGAAVQGVRGGLHLVKAASGTEELPRTVPGRGGVVFVPALVGLGAPYWDPDARGLICGITRGTTTAHIVRATLEAIAHEVTDLVEAMKKDALHTTALPSAGVARMRVDGGASA